jgi:hypothetical protein
MVVWWMVVIARRIYDPRMSYAHREKSARQAAVDVVVKVVLALIITAILVVSGLFLYGVVTGYREPHPSPHQAALERQEQADEGGP